jgi:hypothetical protein
MSHKVQFKLQNENFVKKVLGDNKIETQIHINLFLFAFFAGCASCLA